MIRNYLVIALRNIWRNMSYTVISVSGLTLGITCSLILYLMITFLTSYDTYHANADRIYRVVASAIDNNGVQKYGAGVPAPLPEALRNEITGIRYVLFLSSHGRGGGLIAIEENGDRSVFEEEDGFTYTDSLFFDFFDRRILAGKGSLSEPNEAVISQKLAKKYFAGQDPLGKIIRLDNTIEIRIAGVMDDYPDNTDIPFDLLISYATIKSSMDKLEWGSVYSNDECFVMLEPGVTPDQINSQFPAFIKRYEDKEERNEEKRWLQPLSEMHFDTRFSNFSHKTIDRESLWAMGVVALFLVVTACINFINLTTAVAVKRSREVGIRKVLGSQRTQLVFQHLCETAVISFLAMVASLGLAELGLMQLNAFLGLHLHIALSDQGLLAFLLVIWMTVAILSGSYPAFLMSGLSPIKALKNAVSNKSSGGFLLRRTLVVFQFVISQFLIVGTIIVIAQMDYFNSKDLGFRKEAVLTVPIPETAEISRKQAVKSALSRLPGVERVSLCSRPPSSGSTSTSSFRLDGFEHNFDAQLKMVDDDYLGLFDLTLKTGRLPAISDTATGWIVNEKLVQTASLENDEDILGMNITLWGKSLPVTGVVNDFHTVSLHEGIKPVIIFNDLDAYQTVAVRLKPGEFNSTIREIERVWSAHYPEYLFSYEFVDEEIASFYDSTHKMTVLLIIFSSVAILIGCLGLYGLVSFMANTREKEIGIRKVHGATTAQIIGIFSKEFTLLIILAFAIASPMAGYVMKNWLQNFEYHVPLGWPLFTAGIVTTMVIAFATVGYRSLHAARTNPVDVLRSE